MIDRVHLAALADRLVFGAETTFAAQDAIALLHAMPAPKSWRRLLLLLPQFRLRGSAPGWGASGIAAGVGPVRMERESSQFDLDSHGLCCVRAGQWRLYREDHSLLPGRVSIRIEQVMGEHDRAARVIYRAGVPIAMQIYADFSIPLGLGTITISRPVPWKTPHSQMAATHG